MVPEEAGESADAPDNVDAEMAIEINFGEEPYEAKSYRRYQLTINVVMVLITLIMILPLVLLFMASISAEASLLNRGYFFIPQEFSVETYRYIFSNGQTIFRAYGMTILVTVIGTALNLLLSSTMAYALSIRKLPLEMQSVFISF